MINALSLLQHTDTLTLTPNWHGAQRSAQRSCLPTNYHTTSTTLPPVSTPPPMCLWLSIYSRPSSITFHPSNSLLLSPLITHCAEVLLPTGHVPLIVLHIQRIDLSSNTSLPFSNLFSIIAWVSFFVCFLMFFISLLHSRAYPTQASGPVDYFHSALIKVSIIYKLPFSSTLRPPPWACISHVVWSH